MFTHVTTCLKCVDTFIYFINVTESKGQRKDNKGRKIGKYVKTCKYAY